MLYSIYMAICCPDWEWRKDTTNRMSRKKEWTNTARMNMTKDDTSFFVCAQFSLLFLLGIPLHLNRHIKWDRMTKRICCYGDVQSIFVAFGIVIHGWNLIGIEMKGTNKNVRGKKTTERHNQILCYRIKPDHRRSDES